MKLKIKVGIIIALILTALFTLQQVREASFQSQQSILRSEARALKNVKDVVTDKRQPNSKRPRNTRDSFARGADKNSQLRTLINLFKQSEARRCQVLRETRPPGATCYYLKVEPPSLQEILNLRQEIAKVADHADLSVKQEMDDRIGWLIDQYDPFGQEGRRLLSIRIPDDPSKPLSAWSYPAENVEQEIEKFLGTEPVEAHPQMRLYVASELNNIERFEALIAP